MFAMTFISYYFEIIKKTISSFIENDLFTNAAALAYYTVFSLPPILLIVVYSTSLVYDQKAVNQFIFGELGNMIGQGGAAQLANAIEQLGVYNQDIWTAMLSVGILVFTATTVFVTLQSTLNKIFHVKPKPTGWGIVKFIRDRVLSAALLLAIAFILLVSLSVNAGLSAFADYLSNRLGDMSLALAFVSSIILPLLIITLLFAGLYKWLPDVHLKWKDVWTGAILTAILFMVGKYFISYYIGSNQTASLYDAASSVIVLMLWVFYASLIFFFGAEYIRARLKHLGESLPASEYAVKVLQVEEEIKESEHVFY